MARWWRSRRHLPDHLRARVLAVQASIGVAFIGFILFTSNPFTRLDPAPFEGHGLNPLLQDPGLAFHPPFLYAGYVGLSMAFSFAVAALIEGRVDASWARWVRPWTLGAWTALTVGIAMGSCGRITHSAGAASGSGTRSRTLADALDRRHRATPFGHRRRKTRRAEKLDDIAGDLRLLAVAGRHLPRALRRAEFGACLRQRSDARRRHPRIVTVFVGGALALYGWRAPLLKAEGMFAPMSREGALIVNNLLLTAAAFAVFIGTLYPLFLDAMDGPKITVGPPFFNMTFVPIMVPLLCLVPLGSLLGWKRADLVAALERLMGAGALAIVVCIGVLAFVSKGPWLAALGMALATWLVAGAFFELAWRTGLFSGPLK